MTDRTDAVAIFLDDEELGQMLEGWPAGFCLAVCLDDDGGCAFLVHHRDEDGRILARVGEALNRPQGRFAVVPARPGLPTRRMLFSEERRLMSLVADSEELRECAEDYALNYAFATEEGLDIEAVVAGRARKPAAPPKPDIPALEHPIPLRAERRAPTRFTPVVADETPAPWQPPQATPPIPASAHDRPDLPEGFHPLDPTARRDARFSDALLSLGRPGEVLLTIGAPRSTIPALQVTEVYFRNDLQSFAIPTAVIAGDGPLPARLCLDDALLPAALVADLAQGPLRVRLTASGAHLFVGLQPVAAPVASPAIAAPGHHNLRRRLLRGGLGGGALAAALLLAVQVGLSPAFSGTDHPRQSLRNAIFAALDK